MADNENIATVVAKDERIKLKHVGQAKNAILQLLRELKINKIIYVDDRCSIKELREAFIGKLKALYIDKPKGLDFVNWNEPLQKFEKSVVDLWEESPDEVKRKLFLKILHYEGNASEIENSTAPLDLKNQLNNKIVLLSPSEWEGRKEHILGELNSETKILFLFDINFEYAPLISGRNGIDLVEELLNNQDIKDFAYCGIFSHLFSVDEEFSKRNELSITRGFDKNRFYTISKKRFQYDSYLPGLASGIKHTLVINEVEFLKKVSSKILQKAFEDSLNEIDELSPDSFNHIIQKSSQKEGVWEMATLIRVNNIITKDKALKALLSTSKRKIINKCLIKIRKVEKIKTGGDTPYNKTQIQKLRQKELFIENEILNELHFPISNGDIFKINEKEYILLGQPCNLSLRKNGKRDRDYDIGFFVELENILKEEFHNYSKGKLATLGLLETKDNQSKNYRIARFSTFKPISLIPLDLTVFNTDGKATIDLDMVKHDSKTIQESWKLRYNNLHKIFLNYRDNISTYNKLRSSNKDNLKSLVYYGELFKNYNINNNILNLSGKILTFDIKRVSRYREPYSTDLLQQFMQYLSRNAFEHDFLSD